MQLYRRRDELKALDAEVLLVTFSSAEQARLWRRETGIEFPMLIDSERSAYRAYGLRSSRWRAWQPRVWLRYARMMLNGWKWRGIRDDPHQLGGDFIVDASGALRFAYRSADPTDRPDVDTLLAVLGQNKLTTEKEGIT
jgi:peroxiredoxin